MLEINARDTGRAYIRLTDANNNIYVSAYANGTLDFAFTKIARDNNVAHNSGDETLDGIKTFKKPIVGSLNGNSDTSTKLANTRNIAGVSFDGTKDIDLPGVNIIGNQDTTGNAATASRILVNEPQKMSIFDLAQGIYSNVGGNLTDTPNGELWELQKYLKIQKIK